MAVTVDTPLKALELYVHDQGHDRVIRWEDNGIDVFPGDTYVVKAGGLQDDDEVGVRFYGAERVSYKVQHVNTAQKPRFHL